MLRFIPLLFFSFSLFGEESSLVELTSQAVEEKSYNYWAEFVNMLITLFFIIGAVMASVWVLKRIMRSRVQQLNRSTGIKILERRSLNTKSSLYLVDILGKGVVISESQAGIQLITEFSEKVNVETLLDQVVEEQSPRASFLETVTKKIRRWHRGNSSLNSLSRPSAFEDPDIAYSQGALSKEGAEEGG
ncbi:MAG: flagellar biosynthetic protein FliO [Chlamydiales bacterium]